MTGKTCVKCGSAERDKRGNCAPCARVRAARWAAANPTRARAKYVAWCAANPEKKSAAERGWKARNKKRISVTGAAWRAAHREAALANVAAWKAAHPEARRIWNNNRRSKERQSEGRLSKDIAARLFSLQRGRCTGCREPLVNGHQLDHVMPLALDGSNTDENMQLLCPPCNRSKHAKHPVDFMQQQGFLI